jgi:hypothetical protein
MLFDVVGKGLKQLKGLKSVVGEKSLYAIHLSRNEEKRPITRVSSISLLIYLLESKEFLTCGPQKSEPFVRRPGLIDRVRCLHSTADLWFAFRSSADDVPLDALRSRTV